MQFCRSLPILILWRQGIDGAARHTQILNLIECILSSYCSPRIASRPFCHVWQFSAVNICFRSREFIVEKKIILECPYGFAPVIRFISKVHTDSFFQFLLSLYSFFFLSFITTPVSWEYSDFCSVRENPFGLYGLSEWWREVPVAAPANHSLSVSHNNLSSGTIRTLYERTIAHSLVLWAEYAFQISLTCYCF